MRLQRAVRACDFPRFKREVWLRYCQRINLSEFQRLPHEFGPTVAGGWCHSEFKKHGLLIKDTVNFHDDKQIMYMNLLNIFLHFLFKVYAISMVHMNMSACTCINFRVWVGDWCPAS